ncbi:SRPBCC family protein [Phreatobacter sp. AB_2022a]|uniref:SRPBCC family protein n=1 Tax=Phreatobacter sp. AB_2022a TaxID=3003134 RepID=UPI0022873834|nr:SRPBCC family protein [Phreatobacter sp. AB_2022a]MCZ0736947.1 SRPBCC family protein [Phreatobacter sp. AB_2022a]
MTEATTSFVYVTYIAATPQRVFEAIARPEIAGRYWGHENVSDWAPGSRWDHVAVSDRSVKISGHVVENTPPKRLVITWASPASFPDPKKHSRVTFDITPYDDGMVRLTVTHDELEAGGAMAAGVSKGWPCVLSSLKSFLETGRPLNVFAKPIDGAAAAA